MVKVSLCERNNPCFVCRKKKCLKSGDLMADCPKYRCDRIGSAHGDCESCAFLRGYIRDMYGQKYLDKVLEKLEKDGDSE